MNEIDILAGAGLSRAVAEMVVALHTMASALGDIAAQQQAPAVQQGIPDMPEPPAPEGGDASVRDE